nr:CusA/CzcA family heavy metal efflux RND transporter [uncultured Flavobacterium sp.]
MLNKIIDFSIKNKFIIGLFTLALILFGAYEVKKLPIDAQPDITSNQVQIITVAPSFSAEDIERLITFPIEQATANIAGITELRSFSRFGLSLVTVVFTDATDVYWVRQQISERLTQVKSQIPEGIGEPELGPISTGLGEIYQYVVRPAEGYESKYDATELRTIQDWIVRQQLLSVPGVADVSSFGGKLKQYEIAINPQRLQAHNITIDSIFEALEENNQNTGGAYIENGPTSMFIRSEGLIGSIEDIQNISIQRSTNGIPLLLKDVSDVRIGHATRYGAMTYNDEGEVSGAIVLMLKGENSNDVVVKVKERIEEIKKTLPEGVIIEPFLDRKKMVDNTILTVETNLLEGALIVIFILVLFLGNVRAGFIVASVIPLSLLFAIIMMNIFGIGGNLMSLGALDFGLIVDGAVIIVEAAMHQLYHNKKLGNKLRLTTDEMNETVGNSAKKMVNSAVFGQIIILIVYLPIFALDGIEGKMFKPMAQTVAFALVGAFILSLTYVPMMTSLFLSKKVKTKPNLSDKVMKRVENKHQSLLIKAIQSQKIILASVVAMFALAIFFLTRLGGEFIPSLEEGDFAVEARVLPGSNISTTIEYTSKAAKILKERFPEVEAVVTKIGSAEIPTEPMPMDAGDMIIVLKPKKEWTSAKTFPELSQKMSEAVSEVPGLTTSFQYPVQMRFNELMTGARQDVVLKIFGENLDSLAHYAQKVGNVIQKVDGAQDLYIEPINGIPQVVITFNRALLAQYGLQIGDANRIINMSFAGQSTGSVFEGERRFDLTVRLDEKSRTSIEDIQNLLIPTSNGNQIPLSQIADVSFKNTPNQIQRENAKRRIIIGFNVKDKDVQTVVEDLQRKVDAEITLPTGYRITYGGAFDNLNQAKERLAIAVPIALVMIFIMLYFAFKSIKYSLLIYTAIPLSSIGGIYFLVLRDMPFSISAGVGFIALFGVAVLNGIVLVSEYNRFKETGIKNTTRIVLMGTKTRLRPVLMTAFVASLGFLPMALSNGSGAEVQRPLATVVIGGLLIATFLTLFVVPILYILIEKFTMKTNHKLKTVAVFAMLTFSSNALAQQPLNYNDLIEVGLKNNLSLKQARLETEFQEKNVKSQLSIQPTDISMEFGDINSSVFDQKIAVEQRFQFPTFYAKQKKLNIQMIQTALAQEKVSEKIIEHQIGSLYAEWQYLNLKKQINQENIRVYSDFLNKANLRFEKGATNRTEVATAKIRLQKIENEGKAIQTHIDNIKIEFKNLLQLESEFELVSENEYFEIPLKSQSNQHPLISLQEALLKESELKVEVEKSKRLPDVTVGYYNQSFKEINTNRFQSFMVGVSVPIFQGSLKSGIKSAETSVKIQENQLQIQKNKWAQDIKQLLNEVETYNAIIASYKKTQLAEATALKQITEQQLLSGEINFLDWVILNDQIIDLQNQFADQLFTRNIKAVSLNYLAN